MILSRILRRRCVPSFHGRRPGARSDRSVAGFVSLLASFVLFFLAGVEPLSAQARCGTQPGQPTLNVFDANNVFLGNGTTRHCAGTNAIYAYVCPGNFEWFTSSYQIDFGDGTAPVPVTHDPAGDTSQPCKGAPHVYAQPGFYDITIIFMEFTCFVNTQQIVDFGDVFLRDTAEVVPSDFDAEVTLDLTQQSPFSVSATVCSYTLLKQKGGSGTIDFGDGQGVFDTGLLTDGACTIQNYDYPRTGVYTVRATVNGLNNCATLDHVTTSTREVTRSATDTVVIGLVPDFVISPNPVSPGGVLTLRNTMQVAPGIDIDRVDYAITGSSSTPESYDGTLAQSFNAAGGTATVPAPPAGGSYFVHLLYVDNGNELAVPISKPFSAESCAAPNRPAPSADKSSISAGESYRLSWEEVAGASTYRIIRFRDGTQLETVSTTSLFHDFTSTPEDAGHSLNHLVRARVSCGAESESSDVVTVSVGCTAATRPEITSPPSSLRVGDTYNLTWTETIAPPGQYEITVDRGTGPVAVATIGEESYAYVIQPSDEGSTLAFRVQAQPACGTPGNSEFSEPVEVEVEGNCALAPDQPGNPQLESVGGGPVTGTSFLDLSWEAVPQPVSNYHWMLNGGQEGDVEGSATSPSATANPVGLGGTITLTVQATNSCGDSPAATETAANEPPVASFDVSAAGLTANFVDTSSGEESEAEATSWLWLFGDGGFSTEQNPSHAYAAPGAYTAWLIASNGAGSDDESRVVTVAPAAASAPAVSVVTRSFNGSQRRRMTLSGVDISAPGRSWLWVSNLEEQETILFVRFLDSSGSLVKERRISLQAHRDARLDLAAYGLSGNFTLEVVSMQRVSARLEESARTREILLAPRPGSPRMEDFRE